MELSVELNYTPNQNTKIPSATYPSAEDQSAYSTTRIDRARESAYIYLSSKRQTDRETGRQKERQ